MYKSIIFILLIFCFCPLSVLGQIDTVLISQDYVDEFGDSITVKSAETGFNVYKTDSTSCLIHYEYWRNYMSVDCGMLSIEKREFGTLKSRNPDVKSGLVKRYYSDYSAENIELYSDGDLVSIISQVSFKTFPFDTICPPIYKLSEIDTPENEAVWSENNYRLSHLINEGMTGLNVENSTHPPSRLSLGITLNKQGEIETIEFLRPVPIEFTESIRKTLINQPITPFQLNGTSVRTSFSFFMNISWR
ncbi:MAG: hypothetical protein AB8B53_00650 [Flavobacteriales bacterium]